MITLHWEGEKIPGKILTFPLKILIIINLILKN